MINTYQKACHDKKICIIGAGGLGGNVANLIGRLNPTQITIIDGDKFSEDNLNRQLFSNYESIGKFKAEAVAERVKKFTTAQVTYHNFFLDKVNHINMLSGYDIYIDATDNYTARKLIFDATNTHNIPFVHGAINGLFGQVSIIYPFDSLLNNLSDNPISPTLSFVPNIIASYQVAEMVKYFANSPDTLTHNQLRLFDIFDASIRTFDL